MICEFNFKICDIKVSSGYGKKTLVTGAIPSLFKLKEKIMNERKALLDCRNSTLSFCNFSSEESSGQEFGGGFRPITMCLFIRCAQNIKVKLRPKEENKYIAKRVKHI